MSLAIVVHRTGGPEVLRGEDAPVARPTLFDFVVSREELLQEATVLFDMIRSRAVRVEIRQRWPLAQAQQAHAALESRATTGCSLLLP